MLGWASACVEGEAFGSWWAPAPGGEVKPRLKGWILDAPPGASGRPPCGGRKPVGQADRGGHPATPGGRSRPELQRWVCAPASRETGRFMSDGETRRDTKCWKCQFPAKRAHIELREGVGSRQRRGGVRAERPPPSREAQGCRRMAGSESSREAQGGPSTGDGERSSRRMALYSDFLLEFYYEIMSTIALS